MSIEELKVKLAGLTRWPSTIAGFTCFGMVVYFVRNEGCDGADPLPLVMAFMGGVLINARALWLGLEAAGRVLLAWRKQEPMP